MARKKKSHQAPRRKRMTRDGRLSAARATRWVDQYKGKDVVAGYANWFGVDLPCAVMELRLLGYCQLAVETCEKSRRGGNEDTVKQDC
jgi:hypothetical protein